MCPVRARGQREDAVRFEEGNSLALGAHSGGLKSGPQGSAASDFGNGRLIVVGSVGRPEANGIPRDGRCGAYCLTCMFRFPLCKFFRSCL
jgi:hypothetical protein